MTQLKLVAWQLLKGELDVLHDMREIFRIDRI